MNKRLIERERWEEGEIFRLRKGRMEESYRNDVELIVDRGVG